ncbi:MAG TPA: cellulase family glycosylhydrolase [Polyangia bacterium]|jgi:mannan endo-1,4-beta-mannosidase
MPKVPAAHFSPTRREILQGATVAGGAFLLDGCHGGPAPVSAARLGNQPLAGGLDVRGTRFTKDGKPFFVSGINYWAGTTLARTDNITGGWDQVRRDLDGIQAAGINMIRTMAATEGPNTEPERIVPTIQPAPGQYDPAGVAGVLRFAEELQKRGLFGIYQLSNFWQWSGGFAQYVSWAGGGAIPYPPPAPGGSWDTYQHFAGSFYKNAKAVELYEAFIKFIVPQLKSNPTVIWELANEPRGMTNQSAFHDWIDRTARLIKSLGPGQLVTTGSEGLTGSPVYAGVDPVKDHASAAIDFICFHMWAENWGWVHGDSIPKGYPRALDLAKKYVAKHAELAAKTGKPLLLEEFGFPRDGGSFDPSSPTTFRDQYFQEVYSLVASLIPTTPMAGIMPWAWAGDQRPPRPGEFWKPGDPFIGDPPHEKQGWYSIYDKDTTLKLIAAWSPKITGSVTGASAPAPAGAPTAALPVSGRPSAG